MRAHLRTVVVVGAGRRAARVVPAGRQPAPRSGPRSRTGGSTCWRWRVVTTMMTYVAPGPALAVPAAPARADALRASRSARRSSASRPDAAAGAAPARSFGPTCWRGTRALSATAAFATIVLERVLDMVTVLVLFAVFLLTCSTPSVARSDPAVFRARSRSAACRPPARRSRCWSSSSCSPGTRRRSAASRRAWSAVLPERFAQAVAAWSRPSSRGSARCGGRGGWLVVARAVVPAVAVDRAAGSGWSRARSTSTWRIPGRS